MVVHRALIDKSTSTFSAFNNVGRSKGNQEIRKSDNLNLFLDGLSDIILGSCA